MGLDMYLYVKEPGEERYVGQYWRKANAIHCYFVRNAQKGNDDCKMHPVSQHTLGMLRYFCNGIVEWAKQEGFVFETDGERNKWDVCYEHYGTMYAKNESFMPSEKLKKFCERVLPTQGGFFFGGRDYDCWYFVNVFSTLEAIDELLQLEKTRFYYRSSW